MRAPVYDQALVLAACHEGDFAAIKCLSTALYASVIRRRARRDNAHRPKEKRTRVDRLREDESDGWSIISTRESGGLAGQGRKPDELPDSTINSFIYLMVRACHEHERVPPKALVELIQIQTISDRKPQGSARRYLQMLEAKKYLARYPHAKDADIARYVKVHRSTVGRWRAEGGPLATE